MLHPIKALNQIIEEHRDFILTEFRAIGSKLKEAIEIRFENERIN